MEKADKEKFMSEIWGKYNATKDVEFLAKACEEAPFFGQKVMAFEIARILRLVKEKEWVYELTTLLEVQVKGEENDWW